MISGPLPSIFGLHIATYILCEIAGKPIPNPVAVKGRKKLYEKMSRDFLHREEKLAGYALKYVSALYIDSLLMISSSRLPIDEDDVGLLFEDIHRGRSVVPPHPIPTHPMIVRWDPEQPLVLENCVIMEDKEVERHMKEVFGVGTDGIKKHPEELWGAETTKIVARRAEEIRRDREWSW